MTASRRILEFLEPRLPTLARTLATPSVRGTSSTEESDGVLWRARSNTPRALIVYLTESPALSRWLAGSVASRLRALVLVPTVSMDTTDAAAIEVAISTTLSRATVAEELPVDAPVAIVAEGATATLAISSSRGAASRLALLYPAAIATDQATGIPPGVSVDRTSVVHPDARADAASGVPTTLIQASASGPWRPDIVALERALRAAGTAVRETEYADVADGWARYPKASAGSRRALDDLVAFLDRGIGEASTFDVIPGWDLH